jgi:hypothetical protein
MVALLDQPLREPVYFWVFEGVYSGDQPSLSEEGDAHVTDIITKKYMADGVSEDE